mmetsp:Transcript_18509/g.43806  ORF Transcript_18509/g.43806 Transcript_18509/m.43806 type:complete len:200 (-) Transcript_18509:104-703(-)
MQVANVAAEKPGHLEIEVLANRGLLLPVIEVHQRHRGGRQLALVALVPAGDVEDEILLDFCAVAVSRGEPEGQQPSIRLARLPGKGSRCRIEVQPGRQRPPIATRRLQDEGFPVQILKGVRRDDEVQSLTQLHLGVLDVAGNVWRVVATRVNQDEHDILGHGALLRVRGSDIHLNYTIGRGHAGKAATSGIEMKPCREP